MTCYGHWDLDLDIDGITVPICARYAGHGTEVLRDCTWCCWNRYEDDHVLNYGMGLDLVEIALAEGMEWK